MDRVKRQFAGLFARTICHTTEDLDKVRMAMVSAIGDADLKVSRAEGHHGNPMTVIEASVHGQDAVDELFARLPVVDLEQVERSLASRIDDSCYLFLRIEKQAAYKGDIRLSSGEDVVSIRVKVNSFPARREIAERIVREYIDGLLAKRRADTSA